MAIYAHDKFKQIAAAIDMEVEEIAKHAKLFEEAARWYRLDSASPDRTAPSILRRKLDKIAKSARRLLESLDVVNLDAAVDGPGDPQILDAMILLGDSDATPVMEATQRIARLVEITEAVAAAAELSRRAEQAAAEVAEVGKLTVAEGNRGDRAINDWLAVMMSAYRDITGKEPATSVGGPPTSVDGPDRPDEGMAGGPLIRFLTAAGRPLQIKFSGDAWRSRVRTVLKGASPQD
jgi:hypothetical protein